MELLLGDCLDRLKELEDNSVDAIVTDPPYGLSFMGKKWDYDVPQVEVWKECLRVLKPGGYLLAFAGTRTQHRMAVNIEDAGFEIRDMIAWVYGSGFPKSLNIGKAVDKIAGETGRKEKFTEWMRSTGITADKINKLTNSFMGSHYLTAKEQPAIPTSAIWAILRPHIKTEVPQWVDELVERIEREREVVGKEFRSEGRAFAEGASGFAKGEITLTKGTSEWEGWGTALKPALEPITVARKPIEGTVAENCLKWGVGGINIDGCRVEATKEDMGDWDRFKGYQNSNTIRKNMVDNKTEDFKDRVDNGVNNLGRFPANLIHDGSDEVVGCFPKTKSKQRKTPSDTISKPNIDFGGGWKSADNEYNDSGSASRFFYCAKASKRERNIGCEGLEEKIVNDGRETDIDNAFQRGITLRKNTHPTVKPIALMEYLVKMVSKEGQVVLDPFMGSGTTGMACKKLNRDFIGIEMMPEYMEIAKCRIKGVKKSEQLNMI